VIVLSRRVVVTGLGVVSPLGVGVEENWQALLSGKSGIGKITRFDVSDLPVKIAGEARDFNPEDFIDKKEIKKMDLFIQFSLACSDMLMKDSEFEKNNTCEKERRGVLIGVGMGGLPAIEKYHLLMLEKGYKKVSPFFIPMLISNLASGHVSMRYGFNGPNSCVATACATGSHAIGDAYKIIQRGDADVMIAGGAESALTPLAVAGFSVMRALSTRNDEPERASRPFEKDRDGFIMSEGAGLVLLEELGSAVKRGAKIYGEIAGYGLTGDAFHLTMPDPEGTQVARCMKMALESGGISPEEVDYINAHGTSTPLNDKFETMAIKKVFGEQAYKVPVSSTKSSTGHLLGGAGGVEAVYTLLAMDRSIIPATVNYDTPDPECDLDYVPNKPREKEVNVALSNSFGFGGTNATVLFRKFNE
jgi:3-oxoacyl-[acyl-carrier-protein] synthase II